MEKTAIRQNKTKKKMYFPELDGLRFFAFLLVFVHHYSSYANIPLSVFAEFGWVGVDLFFVLSAFLFTKLLIAEFNKTGGISFMKFYMRRIFRIWPIYFLFIAFSIACYIYKYDVLDEHLKLRIIGLFTFSDNIFTAIYGLNKMPYIAHLWTITYEEQFYIFIPLLILILIRSSRRKQIIILISFMVLFNLTRLYMIITEVPHPAIWVLPVTHFESIVLGLVLGFGGFDSMRKKLNPLLIGLFGVLCFILLCALPNVHDITHWLTLSYALVGFSTLFVLIAVSDSPLLKKFFSIKLFVFLGKRSYGLYLYHLLGNRVAVFIIDNFPFLPSNKLASFFYSLTFTIVVSVISYKLIETPFLKLKKKFEVVSSRPI